MFSLENGRYTVASGATGVIRASRDASVAYANTREVQGQTIGTFQLVKQKIAEMEADYQMSHLLWLKCGYLKNEGKPVGKGGEPCEVAGDDPLGKGGFDGDRGPRCERIYQ
jgi:alkylation response protein AidB-like acyl-CoA dehydrogenase